MTRFPADRIITLRPIGTANQDRRNVDMTNLNAAAEVTPAADATSVADTASVANTASVPHPSPTVDTASGAEAISAADTMSVADANSVADTTSVPHPSPTANTASATDGRARVAEDAAARAIEVRFEARPAANSLEEAAALLGIAPSGIVKTLVVKRHDGSFLFALVPGDRQISWGKLRTIVGVNKLRMPEASIALEATGYERGTITPLGSTTAWPVFADERIVGQKIAMGAGAHGFSAFVDADELIAGFAATVADISD
jgi:Cys-tRNA(Pro)/Cys-tRNA(Cys) deacylase